MKKMKKIQRSGGTEWFDQIDVPHMRKGAARKWIREWNRDQSYASSGPVRAVSVRRPNRESTF